METGKAWHAKHELCDLNNSTFESNGTQQSLMDIPIAKGPSLVPAFTPRFWGRFSSTQSLPLSAADRQSRGTGRGIASCTDINAAWANPAVWGLSIASVKIYKSNSFSYSFSSPFSLFLSRTESKAPVSNLWVRIYTGFISSSKQFRVKTFCEKLPFHLQNFQEKQLPSCKKTKKIPKLKLFLFFSVQN